jgi:hypothetical protein
MLSRAGAIVTSHVRYPLGSLGGLAEAHQVDIRIAESLPTLMVDLGRLELALNNLLSFKTTTSWYPLS